MAAKKFYAVKKGRITGIFSTWDDCKTSVNGFPGAVYKGFATLAEAKEYMGGVGQGIVDRENTFKAQISGGMKAQSVSDKVDIPAEGALLSYVDGSYENSIKKYSFGCVFILSDGKIYTEYGNGDDPKSLQHRNVTGEMLGAMYAVKTAMFNGYKAIEIRYDYQGIEKWVTGEWRSKTELTQKYAASMLEWGKRIAITFTKVEAHTNVKYNELADKLAKKGLVDGQGVPKVKKLEEMTVYEEE